MQEGDFAKAWVVASNLTKAINPGTLLKGNPSQIKAYNVTIGRRLQFYSKSSPSQV